jgi:surfactin synthase thioesterase subunit
MKKIKLFCFPYAGGSAMVYTKLRKHLKPSIELCPVELSGRGRKYTTPLRESLEDILDDIYPEVIRQSKESEFALFGYSMGSMIAYELYHRLKELDDREPVHVFFAARQAPHIEKEEKILHVLSDGEFMDEIFKLGGTSEEVQENKELMEIFTPILRADYKAVELYKYIERNRKLNCDITVLGGNQDDVEISELSAWAEQTRKNYKIHMFEGGHFFIHHHIQDISKIINNTLAPA